MNDPRPFCIRCGERWLPDEGVDAQSVPCQFCARPMTKPDSTDAGGVTHEEARRHVTHFAAESVKASLLTYIDQQEAALATLTSKLADMTSRAETAEGKAERLEAALVTLTRENAELKTRCFTDCNCAPYHMADCPARHPNEQHSPPEGSAPLPGGQGQVEALRHLKEARQHWRAADNYDGEVGIDAMCASLGHVLSYLEDLEQERRDGLGKDSAKGA